jgi:hypothetical protein
MWWLAGCWTDEVSCRSVAYSGELSGGLVIGRGGQRGKGEVAGDVAMGDLVRGGGGGGGGKTFD